MGDTTELRNPSRRAAIKDQITTWIREQGLRAGDRIVPQVRLAQMFDTTEVTIHRALTELGDEGVVHRRRGVGTFVGPNPVHLRVRQACLVLPAAHLDDAAVNPRFWPGMQTMLRAFIEASGETWSFGTRVVAPDADPHALANSFNDYDAVFFHFDRPCKPLLRYLEDHQVAAVFKLGRPERGAPCVTLDHDRVGGTALAVDYLYELGYRRLGFLGNAPAWGQFGQEGFIRGHAERGVTVDRQRIVRLDDMESGTQLEEALDHLLNLPDGCDAIQVDGDELAQIAIEALERRGLSVPGDVGVMGYGGMDAFAAPPLRLASVRIPYRRMIAEALRWTETSLPGDLKPQHRDFLGHVQGGATLRSREPSGRGTA